jgi:hypothetical protein
MFSLKYGGEVVSDPITYILYCIFKQQFNNAVQQVGIDSLGI